MFIKTIDKFQKYEYYNKQISGLVGQKKIKEMEVGTMTKCKPTLTKNKEALTENQLNMDSKTNLACLNCAE